MSAELANRLWTLDEIAALVDERPASQGKGVFYDRKERLEKQTLFRR
jgi:hypothetical protein